MKKITCILLFLFLININFVSAQLKETREFYFNKEINDTLKYSEIDKDLELLAVDKRLKPAYYVTIISVDNVLTSYRNKGVKLTPRLLDVFDDRKDLKYILVETIVVMRDGREKHYKGFKVYLKN